MKKLVPIDIETFGGEKLPKVGSKNYAESCTIRCIAFGEYSYINSKVYSRAQEPLPLQALIDGLNKKEIKLIAHNYTFEMHVLNEKLNDFAATLGCSSRLGRVLTYRDFVCTQALSLMCFGPAKLDLAVKFHIPEIPAKDEEGNALMKATCTGKLKPPERKKTKRRGIPCVWTEVDGHWYTTSDELEERILEYCKSDTDLSAKLFENLEHKFRDYGGAFAANIYKAWELTCEINGRGIRLHQERLKDISTIRGITRVAFEAYAQKTFGVGCGQKTPLLKYVNSRGAKLEKLEPHLIRDMPKGDIRDKLLEYKKYDKTSLAKADKGLAVQNNERLYDGFVFCGAGKTGRWSSRVFQLQNIPRPSHELEEVKAFFEHEMPEKYTHDLSALGVSGLRTCLLPNKGERMVTLDLASIEYRLACHKVGMKEAIEASKRGVDVYKRFAAKVFKKEEHEVTKDERQLGKMSMLALQYGVQVPGLYQRLTNLGQNVPMHVVAKLFRVYHSVFGGMSSLWRELDKQIKLCYNSGEDFYTTLSSGRKMYYGKIERGPKGFVYNSGGKMKSIYGSQAFQHMIQGECRDILILKALGMRELGYTAVMTVHDEMVYSITKEQLDTVKKDWDNVPCPQWEGLPIDSTFMVSDEYFKD